VLLGVRQNYLAQTIIRLGEGAAFNFARQVWQAHQAGWNWPQGYDLANARLQRWRGSQIDRELFENTRYWRDDCDNDQMDIAKLEELLRLLADEIVADFRGWVSISAKLDIPSPYTMDMVDTKSRRLTSLIDQTFADEHDAQSADSNDGAPPASRSSLGEGEREGVSVTSPPFGIVLPESRNDR